MRLHLPAATALAVPVLVAASFADPPFNANAELLGSAVYNPDPDGSTGQEVGDWDVEATVDPQGVSIGTISMDADGLIYAPRQLLGVKTKVQHQLRREVNFNDPGSAYAGFRLVVSNIQEIGFYVGLFDTTVLGAEPATGAYFSKPASGVVDQVDLVTRKNGQDVVVIDNQFSIGTNAFDVVVQVPGRLANSVTFWSRTGGGNWVPADVADPNVPTPGDLLRLSVRVFTDVTGGTTETLTAQVFEFRSPVESGQFP